MSKIILTDYQRTKLEAAISDSLHEFELEGLLSKNEGTLTIGSLSKTAGDGPYPKKINRLVSYLQSKNKICHFLDAATKNENKDTNLALFNRYYIAYQTYEFNLLINCLDKINKQQDSKSQQDFVDTIKQSAYFQKLEVSDDDDIKDSILIINEIVYYMLADSSGSSILSNSSKDDEYEEILNEKIIDFVQLFLLEDLKILQFGNNSFDQWIEKLPNKEKKEINSIINNSHTKDEHPNYHLLIIVEHNADVKTKGTTFTLNAELLYPNKNNSNPLGTKKASSSQKISDEIYKFIEEAEKQFPEPPYSPQLTIELFLDYALLGKKIETSMHKVKRDDDTQVLIVTEYNFVIRSLARAINKTFITKLRKKLNDIKHGKSIGDITNFIKDFDKDKIGTQLKQLQNDSTEKIIGFKICSQSQDLPNGLPKALKKKELLFKYIFHEGIPLCIWMKDGQTSVNDYVSSKLFSGKNGLDTILEESISLEEKINKVLEKIKIFRTAMYNESTSYNELIIGVLYDHPDRIPECLTKIKISS